MAGVAFFAGPKLRDGSSLPPWSQEVAWHGAAGRNRTGAGLAPDFGGSAGLKTRFVEKIGFLHGPRAGVHHYPGRFRRVARQALPGGG